MFFDSAADHKALKRITIHVTDGFAGTQWRLQVAQFKILLAGFAADILHEAVGIDGPLRDLLKVVARINGDRFSAHTRTALRVEFDLGAEGALLVAGGKQFDVAFI